MRITAFLLLFSVIQVMGENSYSQNTRLSLHLKDVSIENVLDEIESQSEFYFLFNQKLVNVDRKVDIDVKNKRIKDILAGLFTGEDVNCLVMDRQILLSPKYITETVNVTRDRQPQEIVVTGKVTDEDGNTLPGVNIIIKGTITGTITNMDGNYRIEVEEPDAVLVFSFVGYTTQEISLEGRSVIDVIMALDVIGIEEVVAVGYGTQRKRDLTGAVASISAEELSTRHVTNASNALQGAVAGVSVTRLSGEPGAGNTIRIRGITTLEGSNDPLILVDDVPVSSLNVVNPEDIESFTVLKDGASSAIYGSRAAAGVIIITTKRAKKGQFAINYSGSHSINKPTEILDFVGVIRYMEMWNEKMWNDAGNVGTEYPTYLKEHIDNYLDNHERDPNTYGITDFKELFLKKSAFTKRHNLSLSGGTEKLRSKASFGYEHQDALYAIRDWKRYTARVNNDIIISEKWGGNVDINYRMIDSESPNVYPLGHGLREQPFWPIVYEDGRFGHGRGAGNSYATLYEGGTSNSRTQEVQAKMGIYFKPIEDLKIALNFTPSFKHHYNKTFRKQCFMYGPDDHDEEFPIEPRFDFEENELYETRNISENRTTQLLANYNKTIGTHKIDAMAGYEEFYSKYENLKVRGLELAMSEFPFLPHAPDDKVFEDNDGLLVEEFAYRSMFGQVNYSFQNKYLVQANIRRDGSSKFANEYRWGNFPSASVGWVITEEPFAENIRDKVSFFKVRASYGSLGNDRLGNYLYISELALGSGLFQHANGSVVFDRTSALRYLVMRDITWETTTSTNLAVDFTTLNDHLSVTADVYRKKTTDMLLALSVPSLIGFDNPNTNVGDMTTKGWEFQANWRNRVGELNYSVAFNLSNSKSIVGDINGKRIFEESSVGGINERIYDGTTITEEGEEFRTLYGYKTDGLFQTTEEVANSPVFNATVGPGDVKFLDISGPEGIPDGIINADDKTHLGSSLPKYIFGGTISADYKGFDFSLVFQGVGKQNRVQSTEAVDGFFWNVSQPTTLYDGNYWSHYNTPEENLNAKYARLSLNSQETSNRFSDYWIFKGSYLRAKSITVGYTLPQDFTQKFGVNSLRLYVAGNDLFSIDNFPEGMDPEYSMNDYFITKSYIFGVKLNF